jgi:hypothetical protein
LIVLRTAEAALREKPEKHSSPPRPKRNPIRRAGA